MQPSHAEPPVKEPAPHTRSTTRVAALLTSHLGSPSALIRWTSERTSLRLFLVRWGLLALGVAGMIAVWAPPRVGGNLARRATVTMSSGCAAKDQRSNVPIEAARLVDGKADRAYDACTAVERGAWVQLELEARATIDTVVVRGRQDCCWNLDALPLVLEIAEEGTDFREVARRTRPFTSDTPWRASIGAKTGRMLRVRSTSKAKADLVLSEIEVYGLPVEGAGSPPPP